MSDGPRPLEGRVAIVTGAGRGIGRAIALGYAAAGADVGLLARTAPEIDAVQREVEAAGGRALATEADVRDPDAVAGAIEATVRAFGGLDLIVVNAGIDGGLRSVADSDPETWERVIDTNLLGAYHCARLALRHLRTRGGGQILFVGSGIGHRGFPGMSAYACSKAALWMLVRVLAQEVVGDGIRVNELIPGPVRTGMGPDDGQVARSIPAEWEKSPEDVVPLALFLATQPATGPTAQSFSLMRREA